MGSDKTLKSAHRAMRKTNPQNRSVLVVESDPDLQWKLARMFAVRGNRVVGTGSRDGALALLDSWSVDLVLVAEKLHDCNGLDVITLLSERLPKTPIILMAEPRADVQVLEAIGGVAACLIKPFPLDALRTLIESVIDSFQVPVGLPVVAPAE
ncbi:MAG: response regulator [Polyangiales bacterium]